MPGWTIDTLPDGFTVKRVSQWAEPGHWYVVSGHGQTSGRLDPSSPSYQTDLDTFVDTARAPYEAAAATAEDHSTVAAKMLTEQLADVPVSRAQLQPILNQLLTDASSAIPFFELYAYDPAMTAQQWIDFQALDQTTKDRLLYDCVRSLAALMRYLTGHLRTS